MTEVLASPVIVPLGDRGLLVRFGSSLSDAANLAAIRFAQGLGSRVPKGVTEIVPNLVSVLLKYDPGTVGYEHLAGEIRLQIGVEEETGKPAATHRIGVRFDGEDIAEAAGALGLSAAAFIAAHNAAPLRVLATGFAPGFVYCGFHPPKLTLPRRAVVRASVPAGTVLFAAGQTAIAATVIPTGWHAIGHTDFRNFDPAADPPTRLAAGDHIVFEAVA